MVSEFVPRYENKDADYITKMAFDRKEWLVLVEEVPQDISVALS